MNQSFLLNANFPAGNNQNPMLNKKYRACKNVFLKAVAVVFIAVLAFFKTNAQTMPPCINNRVLLDDWITTTSSYVFPLGTNSAGFTTVGAGIAGGERDITMNLSANTTTATGNTIDLGFGAFAGSVATGLSVVNSTITYDGIDGVAAGVNTTPGLGDINMNGTGNFSTSILLDAIGAGKSATVTFRVYSDATHWSDASVTQNGPSSTVNLNISLPQSAFTAGSGAAGPADFTSVNAVQLMLSATQNGMDFQFGNGLSVPCTSTVLPVILESFDAVREKDAVRINWKTSTELNVSHFIIEHSVNAVNFAPVATVIAAGNSNILKSYTNMHVNPAAGTNYYRLKTVDLDGTFSYSLVKPVTFESTPGQLTVYPNPVHANLNIILPKAAGTYISLDIYSADGKKVYSKKNIVSQTLSVAVSTLSSGIYFIKTLGKDGLLYQSTFVKQ